MTERIFFERFDDPEREAMDNKRELTVGYQQLQEDSTGQTHCAYVYWRATPADVIAVLEQNPMLWAAVMAHWSMVVRREDAQPNAGDVEAYNEALRAAGYVPPKRGPLADAARAFYGRLNIDYPWEQLEPVERRKYEREFEKIAGPYVAAREAQLREALTRAKNDLQHIAAEASDGTLDTSATLESVLLAATAGVGEIDAALANPSTSAQRYAALEVAVDGIERFLKVATADPGATLGPIAANALAEARRRVDALRALDRGERG